MQPFITPTSLKRQAETGADTAERSGRAGYSRATALDIGDLAHRFLLNCEFGGAESFEAQLQDFIEHTLAHDSEPNRSAIETELKDIFHGFARSKVYAELAGARILGREVSLLMPWNGQIMEGVIDVIYEQNGLLYLADYKTDRIALSELREGAKPYRQQAEIYCEAARRSLKRDVTGFQLIFLRLGEALELKLEKNHELMLF